MPTVVEFSTLTELYKNLASKYAGTEKTAFGRKPNSQDPYEEISWKQFSEDVNSLCGYLLESGFEKGDRIAILSENRYEWSVVDIATQMLGGVNVALYATLPSNQCEYILQDSGARYFFVSTGIQLKKAVEVFKNCPDLQQVIAFDQPKVTSLMEHDFVLKWEDVISDGKSIFEKHKAGIEKQSDSISPGDTATLIYTSGTTGLPKGVVLTHQNIVSNVVAAHKMITINDEDRTLSFLPLCHSFERTAGYYAILAAGAEIYYAESVDTVAKNLTEARPTIVISVPRLFEKIYNLILKSVQEGSDTKKKIFNWALSVGEQYANGKRGLISFQKVIADKLVFNKLKERTGGRVRIFVSGGSALPADIGNFFASAGLRITEGYGLTETSPVIAVNPVNKERFGTVGHIMPGVTVGIQNVDNGKIIATLTGESYPSELTSEAGEIICKGPNVMQGYWGKEKETADVIDKDGWFHTGDIGKFDGGYLRITDRLKHMIVNAGGKNIYPGPIEDMIKASLYIDQVVVLGEGQNFMSALIVPDFEMLKSTAKEMNVAYNGDAEIIKEEKIVAIFDQEIRGFNKKLASHEKIRQFRLLPEAFTVESGDLTPTMKVKRRVIEEKCKALIDEIYKDDK